MTSIISASSVYAVIVICIATVHSKIIRYFAALVLIVLVVGMNIVIFVLIISYSQKKRRECSVHRPPVLTLPIPTTLTSSRLMTPPTSTEPSPRQSRPSGPRGAARKVFREEEEEEEEGEARWEDT